MLTVGSALLAAIPALMGLGALLDALVGRITGTSARPTPGEAGMMGCVLLWLAGGLAHFAVPLTHGVALAAAAAGVAAFAWHAARGGWRGHLASALLAAVIVLPTVTWIVFRASLHYDTGLYHLQTIRWNQQSAVPLGLANLHSRFGFNSSWLVVATMMDLPRIGGAAALLPGAALTVCFFLAIAGRLRAGARSSWTWLFTLIVAVTYAVVLLVRPPDYLRLVGLDTLGSPAPDLAVTLIVLYVSLLCLEILESGELRAAGLAVLLSSFALTVKLSAAPLFAGVAAVVLFRRAGSSGAALRSARLAIVAGAVLLPWVARGLLLSGCVAYPVVSSCVARLPWAVSSEQARSVSAQITSWARRPAALAPGQADPGWLPDWWSRFSSSGLAAVVATLLGLAALFWATGAVARRLGGRREDWARHSVPVLLVAGINLAGVAFWFVSAPDPRFGLGYILGTCAFVLTLAAGTFPHVTVVGRGVRRFLAIVLVVLAARVAFDVAASPAKQLAAPWPVFPPSGVRAGTIPGGQTVNVPAASDQCWDLPLPCTPENEFDDRLSMSRGRRRAVFIRPRTGSPSLARLGAPVWTVPMGPSPWRPWVFSGGTWQAGCGPSTPPRCAAGRFGLGTDIPLVGDWNRAGRTDIAVFRSGTWFLDDGDWVWNGQSDRMIAFGGVTDTPVAGDWSGQGRMQLGVFRDGLWTLDVNGNRQIDQADVKVPFGLAGDVPVAGNWSGEARAQFGIFRNGLWVLDRNGNRRYDNALDDWECQFGQAGDQPVVGDWNGTGVAKIGVYRAGLWLLDYNGNCRWDGPGFGDRMFYYGPPEGRAGAGRW
jgi:hypothetical protein